MRNAALPITLIALGAVGLIWYYGWLPDVESLTALAFVAAGVLVMVLDRVTKSSIVLGPALIAIGTGIWLHDVYHVRWSLLVPLFLILLGALMLVARNPGIPEHRAERKPPE
jgi:hypothetical protein